MKTIALFVGLAFELAACRSTPVPAPETEPAAPPPTSAPQLRVPPPSDVAAAPADARVLASGVAYKVIAAGHGAETVGPADFIQYNLTAWRADGTMVDTNRGYEPRRLPLFQARDLVYRAALLQMRRGERRRIWIPAERAPANLPGPLTYEIELVDLTPAPRAPAQVAAAPAEARRTAKGVRYEVLAAGTGTARPDPWDRIRYHATGWSPDGRMIDSSVARGRAELRRPEQLATGLAEALTSMVVGDRWRAWIPTELGGPLVYELELLAIDDQPAPPVTPKHVAAPPANARRTAAGVAYEVLAEGHGARPTIWDEVQIHYAGWTTDGALFDTSIGKGVATYPVGTGVIPGWTDVFTHMAAGDKWRVWIPAELAYRNAPGRPRGMLVYEIELVDVVDRPKPPATPTDLAAPPADAGHTARGIAFRSLKAGHGTERPGPGATVVVDYTAWTQTGELVDSSIVRGFPHTSALADLVPGMIDALQTMVVGQKARFWIPEGLAFGRPGLPRGTIVFDVELIAVR